MKLYTCKVRAQGNPFDETRQKNVTAGEIRLLRTIHGEDAVLEITETGEEDRSELQERDRLMQRYGERPVLQLFGAVQQSLVADIPATEAAPVEAKKEEPAEKPLPVVERGPAGPDAALFS